MADLAPVYLFAGDDIGKIDAMLAGCALAPRTREARARLNRSVPTARPTLRPCSARSRLCRSPRRGASSSPTASSAGARRRPSRSAAALESLPPDLTIVFVAGRARRSRRHQGAGRRRFQGRRRGTPLRRAKGSRPSVADPPGRREARIRALTRSSRASRRAHGHIHAAPSDGARPARAVGGRRGRGDGRGPGVDDRRHVRGGHVEPLGRNRRSRPGSGRGRCGPPLRARASP